MHMHFDLPTIKNSRWSFQIGIACCFVLSFQSTAAVAQAPFDPERVALRMVYDRGVEHKHHQWIGEKVQDRWYDGAAPKICHICDNVYRYPVDNGSIVTRGLRNLINRKQIAQVLEVDNFLTVIVRKNGERFRIESYKYDLEQEAPRATQVLEWSEPWF